MSGNRNSLGKNWANGPHFWGPDMPILFPQSSQIDSWYRSYVHELCTSFGLTSQGHEQCLFRFFGLKLFLEISCTTIFPNHVYFENRHLWVGTLITYQLHPCLLHANRSVTSVLARDGPAPTKQKLGHCTENFYQMESKINMDYREHTWNPSSRPSYVTWNHHASWKGKKHPTSIFWNDTHASCICRAFLKNHNKHLL